MKKPKITKKNTYSVNALARILGADRRTIDKALVGVKPARTAGKTRYYSLETAQTALVNRSSPELRALRADELRVRVQRLQLKLDTERGLLTDTRLLVEEVGPMLMRFRDAVYTALEIEAPRAMAGMDVPSARIVGRRLAGELLTALQRSFNSIKA